MTFTRQGSRQDAAEFTKELGPGEAILWAGRPSGGIQFHGYDLFVIPFSLVWAGGALQAFGSVRDGAPLPFTFAKVLFLAVGAYATVGRFLHDAWRRSRTRYALTSERAIILSGGLSRSLSSVPLRTLTGLTLQERRSGVGTVVFGSQEGSGWMAGWPGAHPQSSPRFELIPEARHVYEQAREAQAKLLGG
jgi:hypothetical protein